MATGQLRHELKSRPEQPSDPFGGCLAIESNVFFRSADKNVTIRSRHEVVPLDFNDVLQYVFATSQKRDLAANRIDRWCQPKSLRESACPAAGRQAILTSGESPLVRDDRLDTSAADFEIFDSNVFESEQWI